jgi:hypothetical protein
MSLLRDISKVYAKNSWYEKIRKPGHFLKDLFT